MQMWQLEVGPSPFTLMKDLGVHIQIYKYYANLVLICIFNGRNKENDPKSAILEGNIEYFIKYYYFILIIWANHLPNSYFGEI